MDLVQQRSMLVILLAACQTALTAFEAASNELDEDLVSDLRNMAARTERELAALTLRIESSR